LNSFCSIAITHNCSSKDKPDLDILWKNIPDFKINQCKDERLLKYQYCIALSAKISSQYVDLDDDISI